MAVYIDNPRWSRMRGYDKTVFNFDLATYGGVHWDNTVIALVFSVWTFPYNERRPNIVSVTRQGNAFAEYVPARKEYESIVGWGGAITTYVYYQLGADITVGIGHNEPIIITLDDEAMYLHGTANIAGRAYQGPPADAASVYKVNGTVPGENLSMTMQNSTTEDGMFGQTIFLNKPWSNFGFTSVGWTGGYGSANSYYDLPTLPSSRLGFNSVSSYGVPAAAGEVIIAANNWTGAYPSTDCLIMSVLIHPAEWQREPEEWPAARGCINVHASVFTGVDHLEDQAVAVLADGVVVDGVTVEDGSLSLALSASQVKVGLPFTSEFETMNVNMAMPEGSIQGQHYKISNVTFRLMNSLGGFIGPNEDEVYEAFTDDELSRGEEMSPPLEAVLASLYNVDTRVHLGAEYEKGGHVYYKQTDPLPITISAIVPEVSV